MPELEAIRDTADDIIKEATNTIANADRTLREIASGAKEYQEYTIDNPLSFTVIHLDNNTHKYYINIPEEYSGLHSTTLKLYSKRKKDTAGSVDTNAPVSPTTIYFETNNYQLITRIIFTTATALDVPQIYAVFSYDINTPSNTIKKTWGAQLRKAQDDKAAAIDELDHLKTAIADLQNANFTATQTKRALLQKFEALMGPALREGTWQPEDTYANY